MIYIATNKYSGSYSEEKVKVLQREFEHSGSQIRMIFTIISGGRPGADLDPGIVSDGDILAAAGGDGTVNACLQYIHDNSLQKKIRLGIIPMGTGNNMIRSLGLTKNLRKAAEIIKQGRSEKISYGIINSDRVFFNCSIGFPSFVLKNRKTNSVTGYFLDTVRLMPRYSGVKALFSGEVEEEIFAGFFINTKAYMSKFRFLKENNAEPELKYFYICKGSLPGDISSVLKVFLDPKNYKTKSALSYRLTLPDNAHIELDGDIYSRTGTDKEIEIKNVSFVNIISNNEVIE